MCAGPFIAGSHVYIIGPLAHTQTLNSTLQV
jgi:hypothetical protein